MFYLIGYAVDKKLTRIFLCINIINFIRHKMSYEQRKLYKYDYFYLTTAIVSSGL